MVRDANAYQKCFSIIILTCLCDSRATNELFANAVGIRGVLSDGKAYKPEPDYWFGFGLYSDTQLLRLNGLEISDPTWNTLHERLCSP